MSFYARMAITALEQIADKGRIVTLVSQGSNSYDPAAGTFTRGTEAEQSVRAVFASYKAADVDGELIRAEDKYCLIAASSRTGEPTTEDKIKEGSTEWSVVRVDVVKPADTAILYKLQVRR